MTAYVVLGLVGIRPQAGYALAQFASRSIAHMWPIAKSQIYKEFNRLEGLGLIEGSDVAQENLPDKRVYQLTDSGRQVLQAWIADPDVEERFRSSPLTKLFFAEYATNDQIGGIIAELEERAKEEVGHLQAIVDRLSGREEATFPRLTAIYGVRKAEAVIAWATEAREILNNRRARTE